MNTNAGREMTLHEFVGTLYESHNARKEYDALKAENEKLRADVETHDRPTGLVHRAMFDQVKEENDALKAENERLREGRERLIAYGADGYWQDRHDEQKARAEAAEAEVERLREWKESALAVEREWDAQSIATMLGGKLGESCRRVVAEKVPLLLAERDASEAKLAEVREFCRMYDDQEGVSDGVLAILGSDTKKEG